MQLNFEQIKAITWGATYFTEEVDGIIFNRFTKEQHAMYEKKDTAFYEKSLTSSGIRLCFKTDSQTLFVKSTVKNSRSRTYFSFDIFVNDTLIGCLDNFSDREIPRDYSEINFPCGTFEKRYGRKGCQSDNLWQ